MDSNYYVCHCLKKIAPWLVLYLGLFSISVGLSEGEALLQKADSNRIYRTAYYEGTLRINRRVLREKTFTAWIKGDDYSLMTFTNPEDEGTAILKRKDQLWIYYPEVEEILKLSGQLLREGMMGSDFSYEDALDNNALLKTYTVTYEDTLTDTDQSIAVLRLDAKANTTGYAMRRVWIDKKTTVITKMELYSLSKKLLKRFETFDIKKIGQKYIPTRYVMTNTLQKESQTEFLITHIKLDIPIDPKRFTKEALME